MALNPRPREVPQQRPQQPQTRPSPFAFAAIPPTRHLSVQEQIDTLLAPLGGLEGAAPLASMMAFSEWDRCLAYFIRYIYGKSHSVGSIRNYAGNLYHFFAGPVVGSTSPGDFPVLPKHPEDYVREDIEYFIHRPSGSLRNRGHVVSTETINQRLTILSSFYRFASRFTVLGDDGRPRLLTVAPSPTLSFSYGRPTRRYHAFSYEDLRRFFGAIPTNTVQGLRDRAIFLFYFWTARRRSEIARLRWRDLEYGTIIDSDGSRREGWLYRFVGKGKAGEIDTAELPQAAKDALDRYLAASGRMATMTPDSPLFMALDNYKSGGSRSARSLPDDARPLVPATISHMLKRYCRLAGLDPSRLSIHSFRHAAAQQRYEAGEDIRSLQRLLRHSHLGITDTYLRGLLGSADPGAKLLESKFKDL